MDQILEFANNHWILMLALVAVIVAIIANEVLNFMIGGKALEPDGATRLYNREDAVFLDVRGENAYLNAHLPGAVNVPLERLDGQTDKLKRYQGRPVIVYCDSGRAAAKASTRLQKLGLDPIYQLRGGIGAWQRAGLPTESRG